MGTFQNTLSVAPARVTAHDDDVAVQRCPLALNADEAFANVEEHVVPTTLAYWSVDIYPKNRRVPYDRLLGDVSLLVRRQWHATDASRRIGWAVS
jgi:hypothetical protein